MICAIKGNIMSVYPHKLKSNGVRFFSRHYALSLLSIYYRARNYYELTTKINRIQFVYFHHVFENEEKPFYKLLEYLKREYKFISYSDAVNKVKSGDIDDKYMAFSSDDGLKNNLRLAKILEEFGGKCCFFICGNLTGETRYEEIKKICNEKLNMRTVEFLSWDDIDYLLSKGHEIGGHTMSHLNLAQASKTQVHNEVEGIFELLKRKTGKATHFAWPFGRFNHFNSYAAKVVFDTGFKTCASAERGCHVRRVDDERNLCIRRDHLVANWPLAHVRYFITKNALSPSHQESVWPENWFQDTGI